MKVLIEIEFEGDVNPNLVPAMISNRDAVNMTGQNIVNIRVVTKGREE